MAETIACPTKSLSFEQLTIARKHTQAISGFLEQQLRTYLDTLRSLLLPERLLGRLAGSRFDVPGADKVLLELQESYRKLPGKPFDFPQEFDKEWLVEVGARLDLHRWDYSREIATESGKRPILFTSPTRWILAYGPGCSLAQALQTLNRKQDRRDIDQLRQFVANALVMQCLIARSSSLASLLGDLRYSLSLNPHPGLNGLPLVVIQSQIPTFLPPEPLIITATEFSGVPAFIELIDTDAIRQLSDPFKERILTLIGW
jgi:hypothetical protein